MKSERKKMQKKKSAGHVDDGYKMQKMQKMQSRDYN